MAATMTSIEASNPRLLQERIERTREHILKLQEEVDRYADVATTIEELPKKLNHHVMVPIGKRAMMPGKIVRTNEILAHLGGEYFAWQTASEAVTAIERKKKALGKQIKAEEDVLTAMSEKKSEVEKLFDIKKLYEDENIKEIQESEEESDRYPVTQATKEDVEEFFEIEEEERRKNEEATWDWDETMKRMEELEALEERGDEETKESVRTPEEQVAELKAKGNDAFSKRRFEESIDFYTTAIELDPTSHILFGNRSAAYHRLKKYSQALDDAKRAVELDDTWVKGHYRMASALASLERYEDAAAAFDRAFEICPTDAKLREQADDMRAKAGKSSTYVLKSTSSTTIARPPVHSTPAAPPVINTATPGSSQPSVATKVFSGSIVERESKAEPALPPQEASAPPRRSVRFAGSNPNGGVVTLEPVGEPQPVKRVSRFRAQRAGAAPQ